MKTKWPPRWIYYTSICYISAKMRSSVLMKGLLLMAMLVGLLMCVKDASRAQNRWVEKSWIVLLIIFILIILVKKVIPWQLIHECDTALCIYNTKELRLFMFSALEVKKESTGGQPSLKNNSMRSRTSVLVSLPQPLPHTNEWIALFYIALFKSSNYGNYVCSVLYYPVRIITQQHNYGN